MRACQDELEQRVDTLLALKAQGYSYSQLVQIGMKHWNVSDRQVKRYLAIIQQREKEAGQASFNELLGPSLMQYRYLIAKCIQKDDLELARKFKADEFKVISLLHHVPKMNKGSFHEPPALLPHGLEDELNALMAAFEKDPPAETA